VPVFCTHSLELNILRNLMVRIRDNHFTLVWNVHSSVLSCASDSHLPHTRFSNHPSLQDCTKTICKGRFPQKGWVVFILILCIFWLHLHTVCPLLKHIQSQVQTWPEKQVLHQPGYYGWYKCHRQIQEVLPNTQKTWTVAVCRLLGINKHQHLNLTAIKEN
jgi:hypothetical protein